MSPSSKLTTTPKLTDLTPTQAARYISLKLALKNQKYKVPKEEVELGNETKTKKCVTERRFTKRGYNRLIDKKTKSSTTDDGVAS